MKIKIVSWNCSCRFTPDKVEAIKNKYNDADIFVVQECREKDMKLSSYDRECRYWYGDHKEATNRSGFPNPEYDRGIGLFWEKGITVFPILEFNREFRYVIPFEIIKEKKSFILFAVWTKSAPFKYDVNVTQAVRSPEYENLLKDNVVMIGDFNTFAKNKMDLEELENNFEHKMKNCTRFGNNGQFLETKTYYHGKNKHGEDNFGIDDFCFLSATMATKSVTYSVPSVDEWQSKDGVKHWHGSDHCPISVEFNL